MTEAEFLERLRTLPLHSGALALRDDAARLGPYVLTTDTLVEGVHYLADDPPGDVAWKLIATNLSDLAAKGARPAGVLLNYPLRGPKRPSPSGEGLGVGEVSPRPSLTARPTPTPLQKGRGLEESGWDDAFLAGFHEALAHFETPLLGGDTVSLPPAAPRVLTLTAIGEDAAAPPRTGAQAGDALYVTGSIGDAGAGLAVARGEPGPAALLAAYRRPQPRLAEGRALAPLVHAMMDVSDGVVIDARRMAEASGLAVAIDLAAIPLSPGYRTFRGDALAARLAAATAGDDYELLFAAATDLALPVPATRIGSFRAGSGIALTHAGSPVPLPDSPGFQHRA
ncbi:thiamine-phosphate kinase [Sphingomonas immobilis]|uniref:Thiamine-monophosphate kinase n=1 Tax=Sphingomonas immobilis TaxID=3063997 RepID=A0ABT9A6R9_9SPHN|nr:thiamine-phosphate kinase [Sphingomonas sp. CA1-15]MDO7844462.1 thiamine-phosphate kinase [Sphingomonas sp. CA1-15]